MCKRVGAGTTTLIGASGIRGLEGIETAFETHGSRAPAAGWMLMA